jgi:hypothetical protein
MMELAWKKELFILRLLVLMQVSWSQGRCAAQPGGRACPSGSWLSGRQPTSPGSRPTWQRWHTCAARQTEVSLAAEGIGGVPSHIC